MNTSILPTYNRAPMAFERGEGSWLFTNNGDGYLDMGCLLYTSPSPRDAHESRMPSSA